MPGAPVDAPGRRPDRLLHGPTCSLWHPISVSGYHIREASAMASAQELAFTDRRRPARLRRGPGRAGPRPLRPTRRGSSFFFNFHIDFFEEVAEDPRGAAPWATRMRDRVGGPEPVGPGSSARTRRLRRVALGPAAAAQRGPHRHRGPRGRDGGDPVAAHQRLRRDALDPLRPKSASLVLRTQQMIAGETGVAGVADPLGGSFLVERLTDELEAEARDYIARIDALGGMVAAVEAGFPRPRSPRPPTSTSASSRTASARWWASTPTWRRTRRSPTSTAPTPRSSAGRSRGCAPGAGPRRGRPRRRARAPCAPRARVTRT